MNEMSAAPRDLSRSRLLWLAGLCAVIFAAQGYRFASIKSMTWDEPAYLMTGYQHLVDGDFHYMPEHPPLLKEYLALPNVLAEVRGAERIDRRLDQWDYSAIFLARAVTNPRGFILRARLANVALGIALIFLLGWWAYRLWGVPAGALALLIGTFEPNLIANSSLVTIDTGVTLAIVGAAYLLWEILQKPTLPLVIAFGAVTGAGLVTKFSTTFLLIGVLGPVVCIHWWLQRGESRAEAEESIWHDWRTWLSLVLAVALPVLLSYRFVHLAKYFEGFAYQLHRRGTRNEAILFGEISQSGFWDYFIFCLLLKVPLGIWALFIASVAFFKRQPRWSLVNFFLIVVPVASITLAMTLSWVDRGVRYVLPSLVFMILAGSRVGAIAWESRSRALAAFTGAMALWSVWAGASIAPHYLAYFNEIAGGPEKGPRYFVDSNIDWGQDLKQAGAWLAALPYQPALFAADVFGNPQVRGFYLHARPWTEIAGMQRAQNVPVPPLAAPDLVWISGTTYYGSGNGIGTLFRDRPAQRQFGHSVFLYDISRSPADYAALANHYLSFGTREKNIDARRTALAVLQRCNARFPEDAVCRGMLIAHMKRMGIAPAQEVPN